MNISLCWYFDIVCGILKSTSSQMTPVTWIIKQKYGRVDVHNINGVFMLFASIQIYLGESNGKMSLSFFPHDCLIVSSLVVCAS